MDCKFSIDTGTAKIVCCLKIQYGLYESKIIISQIETLPQNEFIEECGGPWRSSITLSAKPHKARVTNIDSFILHMCISYWNLNKTTKPFEVPISHCEDAIISVGAGSGVIFIISLDNSQGCHKVKVRKIDKENLSFFSPNNKKVLLMCHALWTKNAPGFYSAMMCNFKE